MPRLTVSDCSIWHGSGTRCGAAQLSALPMSPR
jgi:hypothetical protein